MIDWYYLAANFLWILGIALVLATLSYARWEALKNKQKILDNLKRFPSQFRLYLAGTLISLGLTANSHKTIEIAFWLFLSALFLGQALIMLIKTIKDRKSQVS